jgi:hypothetical protein
MRIWFAVVAAALFAAACRPSIAPATAPQDDRDERPAAPVTTTQRPDGWLTPSPAEAETREAWEAAASLLGGAPPSSAPGSCNAAPDAKGFYGFYRTDAWDKGDVVLTFDDGPHPTATPRVLEMLAEHRMPATFFLVGRAISRDTYPLVQRVVRDGHTLGSHSYSHDVHMTRVGAPDSTMNDIRGQHEVTTILIDIALMAQSGDDFDAMFEGVFEHDPRIWLTAIAIRRRWSEFAARHRELLLERGYEAGTRPYAVLYSRPPGGGPYVEHDGAAGIKLHDAALAELGMMNVMWHGASGDTVPERRSEIAFLTDNMDRYAKSGGVLLIHDYIRPDALAHALDAMAASDDVHVRPIEDAVRRKYGCSSRQLAAKLRRP